MVAIGGQHGFAVRLLNAADTIACCAYIYQHFGGIMHREDSRGFRHHVRVQFVLRT